MEGVTGYIFRRAYHQVFEDFDEYITPFLSPTNDTILTPKERNEILPEHNTGMHVIPQIITSRGYLFAEMAEALKGYGYDEVNLNLGCPSQTVVSKKKGAGVLRDGGHVRELLEDISTMSPLPFSVKMRVGFESAEEFERLLEIVRDYKMTELIIHPRTRSDYYTGPLHPECIGRALEEVKAPVVFNGDVFDYHTAQNRLQQFPELAGIMLGRGIIRNPFLLEECRKGAYTGEADFKKRLQEFLDLLLEGYAEIMKDEFTTLFRLKEAWCHLGLSFSGVDKALKGIKKSSRVSEYKALVREIIRNGERIHEIVE